MHGDFSRDSYDPAKQFTGLLMQQGRLIVDADWNEQSAITLHYLRALAADLIGPHGGLGIAPGYPQKYSTPSDPPNYTGAFVVSLEGNDRKLVKVTGGRYYIDGILIDWPIKEKAYEAVEMNKASDTMKNQIVLVDAWERHVSAVQDFTLLDPALQGLDTCTRRKLEIAFWVLFTDSTIGNFQKYLDGYLNLNLNQKSRTALPNLTAWTKLPADDGDCCDNSSDSGFTGLENQLYRVEVHDKGTNGKTFWGGPNDDSGNAFTLKWSRDNGSVAYAAELGSGSATLKSKWRDETRAIQKGDWVELIKIPKEADAYPDETGELVAVTDVRDDNGTVTVVFVLSMESNLKSGDSILLRRWDHRHRKAFPVAKDGGFLVEQKEGEIGTSVTIPLEDNLYVRISLPGNSELRVGDYWLIPARGDISDIIWPKNNVDESGNPTYSPVPARYTEHHYAPIAFIQETGDEVEKGTYDLRHNIKQATATPTPTPVSPPPPPPPN